MIPNKTRSVALLAAVGLLAAGLYACDKNDAGDKTDKADKTGAAPTLAPTASALPPPKAPTAGSVKLKIDTASSKVDFFMEAPKEKIVGHVPGTTVGEFNVDTGDVTRSTGTLTVDLEALNVVQAKAEKDGKFGEEKRVEAQNEHARTWLEIGKGAPEDMKKQNALIKFSIKSIDTTDEKSLMKLTGPERKITLNVTGDFLLHGHKAQKTAALAATFKFDGDKLVGASFKSTKPFAVDLAEHDVKPRDTFGKLALKTLETLSPKVAKEALVSLDLTATP